MKKIITPEVYATGIQRPDSMDPILLPVHAFRNHPDVYGLKHNNKPVVMWTSGAIVYSGSEEGEHDGMRSGASSGFSDTKKTTSATLPKKIGWQLEMSYPNNKN